MPGEPARHAGPETRLEIPGATPPQRVVVWGHAHVPVRHDVIGPGDLQHDTTYSRLLVRSLMRAQLGLSLMCLALALTVTASFPMLMALAPPRIGYGCSACRSRLWSSAWVSTRCSWRSAGFTCARQVSSKHASSTSSTRWSAAGSMANLPAAEAIACVTLLTITVGARGVRISRTSADFLVAAREVRPGSTRPRYLANTFRRRPFWGSPAWYSRRGWVRSGTRSAMPPGIWCSCCLWPHRSGVSARTQYPISPVAGWNRSSCAG